VDFGGRHAHAAAAPPELQAPAQVLSDLWVYDFGADSLSRLTESAKVEKYPAWSPDGRYIAFIDDEFGIRTLRIMNYATRALSSIPLPGRVTTRICNRTVLHPSWAPSATEIVVSLNNCDDEVEANEITDLWRVDVSSFLP
jgi:Tol biopolymer transport system component